MSTPKPSAADLAVARATCDQLLHLAAETMAQEAGAPIEMIIDRFATYTGAQIAKLEGSARAAEVFRQIADQIDAGLFDSVTGERPAGKVSH